MNKNKLKSKYKINKIDVTNDTLTGRGGMAVFVRYLSNVEIYPLLSNFFDEIRKNNKGIPVWNIFKQVFCWLYDGTSRHISYSGYPLRPTISVKLLFLPQYFDMM